MRIYLSFQAPPHDGRRPSWNGGGRVVSVSPPCRFFAAVSPTPVLRARRSTPQPLPLPKNVRVSINKIRGYSKVFNQGNQRCFQRCEAQTQRWAHLCLRFNCLLLHFHGGGVMGVIVPYHLSARIKDYPITLFGC